MDVYIVTYPDEEGVTTVTAFDNFDAAKGLYTYLKQTKCKSYPDAVTIDKVPVYSNFSSIDPFWDQ